jgi:Tol biopolymer transport system component
VGFPFHSRMRPAFVACALGLLSACAEGAPLSPLVPPVEAPPAGAVQVLACRADVRAGAVTCDDAAPAGPFSADRVIGGQNLNVRLVSSNVSYDTTTLLFGADVTVQNLMVQRMGTADGTLVPGVRVFFHSGPVATAGAGAVSVANADGVDVFTGVGQPYFHYPQVLPLDSISAPRRWLFEVPRTAEAFAFSVYVYAPLLPVVVFDRTVAGNRDIWRVALDGSDLVQITSHLADDQAPTVAQGRVVFTSYRSGTADLYSVPLKGSGEVRLTTTTSNLISPALSRDGLRLAFANDAVSVHKVWTAAGDGSGLTRATPAAFGSSGSPEGSPTWHPAGDRIAFMSTANGNADIWAMALGGTPYLLAGGAGAQVEPAWSPDGTRVAFASNHTGDTEIYVVDVSTGVLTQLTTRTGSDAKPAWLADGRIVYVAFEGSTPSLRWLDPAVPGTSHPIPTGAGPARNPAPVLF